MGGREIGVASYRQQVASGIGDSDIEPPLNYPIVQFRSCNLLLVTCNFVVISLR